MAEGRAVDGNIGAVPFSWPVIESWSRLMHRRPTPDEALALIRLDYALRPPAETKESQHEEAFE